MIKQKLSLFEQMVKDRAYHTTTFLVDELVDRLVEYDPLIASVNNRLDELNKAMSERLCKLTATGYKLNACKLDAFLAESISNSVIAHNTLIEKLSAEIPSPVAVKVNPAYIWKVGHLLATLQDATTMAYRLQYTINIKEDGSLLHVFRYRKVYSQH